MGWLGGVEVGAEKAEEGRRAGEGEAAEEVGVGDDAAEGGANGAGAGEVGRRGEAEEDVLQEIVGESRLWLRGRRRSAGYRVRRRGHRVVGAAGHRLWRRRVRVSDSSVERNSRSTATKLGISRVSKLGCRIYWAGLGLSELGLAILLQGSL